MRRTALARKTPLSRSPMKRRTSRRVARKSDSDKAYTAWIHTQPCIREGWHFNDPPVFHECSGRTEQSHLRDMTGMGRKEPDSQSIPMCSALHADWEQHKGPFTGMNKEDRRVWFGARIAETHAAYLADGGVIA